MTDTKHAPTPWNIEYGHMQSQSKIRYWQITDGQDAVCNNQFCYAQDSDANAAHIVKCVNMHEELVEGFSELFNWLMKFNGEEEHKENTNEEDEADFKMLMRCQETLKKAGAL